LFLRLETAPRPNQFCDRSLLLTLEEIYGAITFYLSHQEKIDTYLSDAEIEFERQRQLEREADPQFYKRFEEARAAIK
jgi:hypothetical protein